MAHPFSGIIPTSGVFFPDGGQRLSVVGVGYVVLLVILLQLGCRGCLVDMSGVPFFENLCLPVMAFLYMTWLLFFDG